jgi:hypothetical protein
MQPISSFSNVNLAGIAWKVFLKRKTLHFKHFCKIYHEYSLLSLLVLQAFIIALGIAAFGAGFSLTVFIIMLEWEKQEQLWDTKVAVIGGTLILHVVLPIASVIFILQFIPTR